MRLLILVKAISLEHLEQKLDYIELSSVHKKQ